MSIAENKNISVFERYPKRTIFYFLLAVFLIIDFLSANTYRFLTGYSWNSRNEEQHKIKEKQYVNIENTYRIHSEFYHHDLAANKAILKIPFLPGAYDVYTNSLGFRDRAIREVSLISDKQRIIFIGDSFTEGLGMNYEDTFVGLIGKTLSKEEVEVLNAGVVSYSPIIYWKKVKYLIENVGLKFNQLVVFLDISDAQDEALFYSLDKNGNVVYYDIRKINREHAKRKDKKYSLILFKKLKIAVENNSILLYTVLHNLGGVFFPEENVMPPKNMLEYDRSGWTIDDKLYRDYGEQGLKKMQFYMDKLDDLLKKSNIQLTVAVYPWPVQIMCQDLNSTQVAFWDAWCKRHGVNFINYFPYFVTGKTEKDRKQVIDKYFIKNNIHWDKEGHRLIADIFLSDYGKQEFYSQKINN